MKFTLQVGINDTPRQCSFRGWSGHDVIFRKGTGKNRALVLAPPGKHVVPGIRDVFEGHLTDGYFLDIPPVEITPCLLTPPPIRKTAKEWGDHKKALEGEFWEVAANPIAAWEFVFVNTHGYVWTLRGGKSCKRDPIARWAEDAGADLATMLFERVEFLRLCEAHFPRYTERPWVEGDTVLFQGGNFPSDFKGDTDGRFLQLAAGITHKVVYADGSRRYFSGAVERPLTNQDSEFLNLVSDGRKRELTPKERAQKARAGKDRAKLKPGNETRRKLVKKMDDLLKDGGPHRAAKKIEGQELAIDAGVNRRNIYNYWLSDSQHEKAVEGRRPEKKK